MISRTELEGLIVEGLVEIRRAESQLTSRFKRLKSSKKNRGEEVLFSLKDLEARAARLESMLEALSKSNEFVHQAAA